MCIRDRQFSSCISERLPPHHHSPLTLSISCIPMPLTFNFAFMPENCFLYAYMDITAIIEMAQILLSRVMRTMCHWIQYSGLQLAGENTETRITTKRETLINPRVDVADNQIQVKQTVRYIGVMIDKKHVYWEYLKKVADKSVNVANTLSRLMANIEGPKCSK